MHALYNVANCRLIDLDLTFQCHTRSNIKATHDLQNVFLNSNFGLTKHNLWGTTSWAICDIDFIFQMSFIL